MIESVRRLAPLAAILLLAPASADGATVSGGAGSYRLQAAPTEINDVDVYANEQFISFRDYKTALTPGPGCYLTGDGAIECLLGGVQLQLLEIDLGDGDDVVKATNLRDGPASARPPPRIVIEGGDGNDDIRQGAFGSDPDKSGLTRGGAGNDKILGGGVLEGGPGDDRVLGAFGYSHDRVSGDDGHDIVDGGGGPDVVSGGEGDDTMYEGTEYCAYEGWCTHKLPLGTNYDPNDDGHLDGGPGNDRMGAGGNLSTIAGGPGDDDIVSFAVWADGGDGNDTLRGGPLLRGGSGDDTLLGSSYKRQYPYPLCCGGPELLEGGPGQDSLTAGRLDAVLDGGEGADALAPGGGTDTLSYRSRSTGVQIDLSGGSTGALSGEGDRVEPGFERLEGSAGDDLIIAGSDPIAVDGWLGRDRILGGPGGDTLSGGGHDDVILGGGGNDVIEGGADSYTDPATGEKRRAEGNDFLDGGPGADQVIPGGGEDWVLAGSGDDYVNAHENTGRFARHPLNHSHIIQMSGADQVFCGKGSDAVAADYADALALDCELTDEGTPRWRQLKVTPGRALRLTVRCAWGDARPCKGTARLRTDAGNGDDEGGPSVRTAPASCRGKAGTVLARSGFRIRAGRVNYVSLKLTAAGERLLRRRGCVAVRATLSYTDAEGRDWLATRSLVLKRRGYTVRG